MKLKQNTIIGGSNKRNKIIEPMLFLDWIEYVETNDMCLKMSDIEKLKPGESIKIAASLIQQSENARDDWDNGQVIRPEEYFSHEIFTFPNILNGHKYGKSQFDPEYDPDAIEPFYDDTSEHGYAVLGSGSDTSILWSKLKGLPGIIYEQ